MTKECITHHYACDCREKKFKELEAENKRLQDHKIYYDRIFSKSIVVLQDEYSDSVDYKNKLEAENKKLKEYLKFCHERLINVYKENPRVDYHVHIKEVLK